MKQALKILDLGLVGFQQAWDFQTELHRSLIDQKRTSIPDKITDHHLLFCEHPHVFTLGKSGQESHLLADNDQLDKIQATFHRINRGGDITYHGPGQLVVYPILDLEKIFTDVHKYVRYLEESVIRTLHDFDLKGDRITGLTGVWIDIQSAKPRKICAIGVHLSRWVSLHGLALNINTDLRYFEHIIPCGIQTQDKAVCSMQSELGAEVSMELVKSKFLLHFCELFELKAEKN